MDNVWDVANNNNDTKVSSRKWGKTSGTQGSMMVLAREKSEKGF